MQVQDSAKSPEMRYASGFRHIYLKITNNESSHGAWVPIGGATCFLSQHSVRSRLVTSGNMDTIGQSGGLLQFLL
jgi:hypothetical protein